MTKISLRQGKGGKFSRTNIDAGLRPIEMQSRITTDAMQRQATQQFNIDKMQISSYERNAKLQEQNAKEIYKTEIEAPFKARSAAIKRNADTQIQGLQRQSREYEKLASVWSRLSPTLAKSFSTLATNTQKYLDTEQAIDQFDELTKSGALDAAMGLNQRLHQTNAFTDIVNKEFDEEERARKGDIDAKVNATFLRNTINTRNPVLQQLLYNAFEQGYDGIQDQWYGEIEGELDQVNVVRYTQQKTLQLIENLGYDPKSELGLKMQKYARSKALVQENQLTLESEFLQRKEIIDTGVDKIQAALKNGTYEEANAQWKHVHTQTVAIPVKNQQGVYSRNLSVNPMSEYKSWVEANIDDVRFSGAGGLLRAQEVLLGKTTANPNGWQLNGAKGNGKNDRLLSRFPNFEQEFYEMWSKAHENNKKISKTIQDAKHKAAASEFEQKLLSGGYKGKDGRQFNEEFWNDWSSSNGNPKAREVFGTAIGFATNKIDVNTVNSNLVKAYRRGDMMTAYMSWATSYSDENQEIGFIIKDIKDLAYSKGVEVNKLDNLLLDTFKDKLRKVYGHDSLTQVQDDSSTNKAQQILGATLSIFAETAGSNRSVEERYNEAVVAVDALLGIKDGIVANFDDNGYRGQGIFRQKRTDKGGVIFVRDAGQVFENITSIEISDELTGPFGGQLKGDNRKTALFNLIQKQVNNKGISNLDLYNFLSDQPTNNRLLNHIVTEQMGNVDPVKFKNELRQRVDIDAEFKKNAIQWGAKQWCDDFLGATATGDIGADAFSVCVQALEKETGTQAWEFFLNPALREQLQRTE